MGMRKYRKIILFLSKQNQKKESDGKLFCIGELLQEINWWEYIGSVVTVFIIGAFRMDKIQSKIQICRF